MTIEAIKALCAYHHTASRRGYVSRKNPAGVVEPYNGKFGEGYAIVKPRWDTTQYVTVEYWIKKEG